MTNEQIEMLIKRIELLELCVQEIGKKANATLNLVDGFFYQIEQVKGQVSNKLIDVINSLEDLRREVDSLK